MSGGNRPLMRWLAGALTAVALASCQPSPQGPTTADLDTTALLVSRLRESMAEVSTTQEQITPRLRAALDAVREVDVLVARFRSTETIHEARDSVDIVAADLADVQVDGLRPAILEVAFAVDQARAALVRAQASLEDEADRAYLAAEDAVLEEVRAYAEAADALAQILIRHWPTYSGIMDETAAFAEAQWFYRTDEEAVGAYEVEVNDLLPGLRTAQDQIARFRERLQEQADAVNLAAEEAARVWRDRPTDPPSPSASP